MYADEFDQSPEQVTLTNQWKNTKTNGRDDEEIERDRKKLMAERKAARQKPNANNDNEKSKESEATKPLLISSLPPEVWSVCLEFLPPRDLTIASTCLSRDLSTSYAREQAAWGALTYAISKLYGRVMRLERYPEETWIGLYRLFWYLLKDMKEARKSNSDVSTPSPPLVPPLASLPLNAELQNINSMEAGINVVDRQDLNDTDNMYSDKELAQTTFWLIFGYDEPVSSIATSVRDIVASMWCQIISRETIQWKAIHRARVQSSALRLRDMGNWSDASAILTSFVEDTSSRREDDEIQVTEPRDSAEINICISTFLIDRLYANTYVSRNASESKQLSDAVICGRKAIALCLQSHNSDTGNSRTAYVESCLSLASNLPPPVSLYSSDVLRLAASQLALGRALALLAQHVGLDATRKEDVIVRLSSNDVGFSAEGFFQEGELVLKSSIETLLVEQQTDDSIDVLEILAGTYAALGELYYCKSSVTGASSKVKDSIRYLTLSLRLVHHRLVNEEGAELTIQAFCTRYPRSLMILQAQTAKDLGKVYHFSYRFATFDRSLFQQNILHFALIVSMQYYDDDHPSLANIIQLGRGHIHGTKASLEVMVNQILGDDFLPEYTINK